MNLRLLPARVRTDQTDAEGKLVFADGSLVAVLTHLSDEYGDKAGMWFLETGLGLLDDPRSPKFADLDEAQDWIMRKLASFPAHGGAGGAP
ncbi:hypothetical protein [Methylobacterium oxalidis]|uniref:hypothetical protein n=1 Tax=Methylobacterium oxalidis TaxID=944322 RepID=UPI003314DA7E